MLELVGDAILLLSTGLLDAALGGNLFIYDENANRLCRPIYCGA